MKVLKNVVLDKVGLGILVLSEGYEIFKKKTLVEKLYLLLTVVSIFLLLWFFISFIQVNCSNMPGRVRELSSWNFFKVFSSLV